MATVTNQVEERKPVTRNTIQRALVLEAVQSLHEHPTSADVYEAVRAKHPNISRATVYRNLGVLADKGEVLRVEVAGGADRYDFFNEPHYHARCRQCGMIFDVDMPYRSDLTEDVIDSHGFKIEGHQIMFDGVCPDCQKK
ncbi:Fur family transcriptional regulator [Raoultibacter massiliensis]|uniref:Transcriptional repressor n=1 Tax=Raoultibacter massiliensis TaxID=1852371 RepID=A0ABV1JG36_9ACTN|nr:transcriptional repressor [Raoultibacter massiliensis]